MRLALAWVLVLGAAVCAGKRKVTEMRGSEGETVTVTYKYEGRYKGDRKFFCRATEGKRHCIYTTKLQEGRNKRFSIQDNPEKKTFTVRVEQLERSDAGIYYCGISCCDNEISSRIRLTVTPGTKSEIPKPNPYPATSSRPTVTQETFTFSGGEDDVTESRPPNLEVFMLKILVPSLILLLLLLLSAAAGLMWKQRQRAQASQKTSEPVGGSSGVRIPPAEKVVTVYATVENPEVLGKPLICTNTEHFYEEIPNLPLVTAEIMENASYATVGPPTQGQQELSTTQHVGDGQYSLLGLAVP